MEVRRALFCTESPRSTQQIHELFVPLGVETCRTTLPQSVRPVCTATSQRALLVCTACVMSVCSPVDVQSASAVTSWSWAVFALSEWSKDPMLLEDLAWKSAGLCSAPRVRGPRSKSMSCLCRSVWRLAERPCPHRFSLCAQRRARGPCSCTACVMPVCSPVDVQCASAVTSWSWAVCALSEWSKDPMLLEDLAWMSAGLCSAPRVRGPRSKSMSCLCSSVWRLAERPCPNRFGLCAQRRARGPCSCAQLV